MTRDEMIEHWADIAAAVFKAEDAMLLKQKKKQGFRIVILLLAVKAD